MRLNWGTAPIGPFEIFEICLVLIAVAVAFLRPGLGGGWFRKVEAAIARISRRHLRCALLLFLFPIVLRLILLPVYGPPAPIISDEYAYLLQADTFASGRLTNPPPALPEHFTSVYVLAQPTYNAEYQPGQGLVLAAGQVATGLPWSGVLLSMGVLCAAVYWALLAWLPETWAFAATFLIVDVQLGVLSYWVNSYWGGCVPAIGGALVLGALPRILTGNPALYSFVTASGLILLINSRPLEGLFLILVVSGALLYWTFLSKEISSGIFVRRVVPSFAVSALAAMAFAGYYNYRVTGKATEFPYLLYRAHYGLPQGFFWQKPVTVNTTSMPADIRSEYEDQMRQHERRKSVKALLGATGGKLRRFWEFYIGIPLTLTLLFLPFIARTVNFGLAIWTLLLVLGVDNLLFFAYFPHYSAAVAVLIVFVLAQCIRRMRQAGEAGLFLSRALPLVCCLVLLVTVCGRLFENILPPGATGLRRLWQSEFEHDIAREKFAPALGREPGLQLVLVRYKPYNGLKKFEWIFNRADIDRAKVVWAREVDDPQSNQRLIEHLAGRKLWLAEPDAVPPRVTALPGNRLHSLQ